MQHDLVYIHRILHQRLLDPFRTVLLAIRTDKQRLEPAYDIQHLGISHISHIPGMKPAINDCLRGRLRILPVAGHHILSLDHNLPFLPVWQFPAIGIKDLYLHWRHDLS